MNKLLATVALCACVLPVPTPAQVAVTGSSVRPLADDALYQSLGGRPGLAQLMADFVPRLKADPGIGPMFKDVKATELQKQLADQFCVLAGGPCVYEGASMKNAHADHKIRKADFYAMVELLQLSMDAQGIPFATQNRLLAQLAPMHREVINSR